MNNKLFSALSALLCLAACDTVEKDVEIPEKDATGKVEVIITASTDTDTKTVLDANYTTVLWKPSDEIKVFSAGEDSKFTSLNTTTSSIAQFRGMISVITGISEGVGYDNNIYGLYPYNDDATLSNGVITTTLPNTQTAVADSFDDDLFITIGKSETLSMGFYNVCSGLRFTFSEGGYTSATLSSNNGEALAGTFSVGFDQNGKPAIQSVSSPSTSITINAPTGGFVANTWYYVICLPGTYAGGITMSATNESRTGTYEITSSLTFERSRFKQVANLDGRLSFPQRNNEIWYTSSTGNVVIPYSTVNIDATIVSNTYSNGRGIIVFDSSPTNIGNGTFAECDDLVSISLPNSVTSIGDAAFDHCTNLVSVILPNNLTSLGVSVFVDCTSLKEIDIPDSVLEIGACCFSGCSSLVRVSMPSSISIISASCFDSCSSLSDISIPSNVTHIERTAFRECMSLPSVFTLPENVWYIGNLAFYNCTNLSKVYILHETAAVIDNAAFAMCSCNLYVPSVSLEYYAVKARSGGYPFNKICSFDAEFIEPVDLGLSIKWAPVNVGATTPTKCGGLFAWGEITPKGVYQFANYKWYDYDNSVYTQYTNVSTNALNGTPDNREKLSYWDDAARMNWGGDWRMPSLTEIEELVYECEWTPVWVPDYGGLLLYMQVTGPNGNSIILPTGDASAAMVPDVIYAGYYWSRELLSKKVQLQFNDNLYAMGLTFIPDDDYDTLRYFGANRIARFSGCFVRPVYEKL